MSLNWGIVSAFAVLFGSVKARKALDRLGEVPQSVPLAVPAPPTPTPVVPKRIANPEPQTRMIRKVIDVDKAAQLLILEPQLPVVWVVA